MFVWISGPKLHLTETPSSGTRDPSVAIPGCSGLGALVLVEPGNHGSVFLFQEELVVGDAI